jgi:hypothetical protein
MSEELSVDQLLRIQAVEMTVKFHEGTGLSELDLIPCAKEIYEFIKGETK